MPIKTISEGITNSYLVPGIGVFVVGAAFFAVTWMLTLPIIVCAIGLLTATTGVQIDTGSRKYRTYLAVFGYKLAEKLASNRAKRAH